MSRHAIAVACAAAALCIAVGTHANAPPGRYTITSNTVFDTKTNLTWQRIAPSSASSWASAMSYCASLSLSGSGGWRVPTVKELSTLLDATQLEPIDLAAFPGTNGVFWSSTPEYNTAPSPRAWTVDFSTPFDSQAGDILTDGLAFGNFVRCVR